MPRKVVADAQAVDLGSGLIDHSQKMTTAAMQMADMNVWSGSAVIQSECDGPMRPIAIMCWSVKAYWCAAQIIETAG
jgi:hypothetical protein